MLRTRSFPAVVVGVWVVVHPQAVVAVGRDESVDLAISEDLPGGEVLSGSTHCQVGEVQKATAIIREASDLLLVEHEACLVWVDASEVFAPQSTSTQHSIQL